MVVVFFGKRGIIKTICLDKQKRVAAKWYTESCKSPLIESLKNLRPNSGLGTWRLHHDNAPACGLLPMIKDKLKGRCAQRFSNDDELIQAWESRPKYFENIWISGAKSQYFPGDLVNSIYKSTAKYRSLLVRNTFLTTHNALLLGSGLFSGEG